MCAHPAVVAVYDRRAALIERRYNVFFDALSIAATTFRTNSSGCSSASALGIRNNPL